ncbi:MAG: oligoribonuclease [SAR324 cluster bacterium]|uniref:Oligoribonuclease n=1 Tax=SAR324 cluster bacterium TaxID=2024889 RepID=A0A2A4T170_9DELT|nr:MAG: oligoribonuclease [SAR324 cluster bacterium]
MSTEQYLVWMDLEMTGLDPASDTILEIATIVTNQDLEIIEVGPEMAIFQADEVLDQMGEWCQTHHGASGLTERVRQSPYSMRETEIATLSFIQKFVAKGQVPLCGNSIHQDRRFLAQYMAELNDYLHYRNVDVSTIKELAKRWYPNLASFKKENKHTALEDIKESIAELHYYRQSIFIKT